MIAHRWDQIPGSLRHKLPTLETIIIEVYLTERLYNVTQRCVSLLSRSMHRSKRTIRETRANERVPTIEYLTFFQGIKEKRRVNILCREILVEAKNITNSVLGERWYLKRRSAIYSVDDGLARVYLQASRAFLLPSLPFLYPVAGPPTVSHVSTGCSIGEQRMLAARRTTKPDVLRSEKKERLNEK